MPDPIQKRGECPAAQALRLFRSGLDTIEIGNRMGLHEAAVVRLIEEARFAERRATA